MKVKRSKRAKKAMSVYMHTFGFHEPFQVIVDGTICMAALQFKTHLQERVPDYLGSKVQLLTTRCLYHELEALGDEGVGAKLLLKRIQFRSCHHKKHRSAKECMLEMIGAKNEHRYIVATVDPGLTQALSEIPGVPVLTLRMTQLVLRRPSPATLAVCDQTQHSKLGLAPREQKLLQRLEGRKDEGMPMKRKKKRGPKEPNPLSVKKAGKASKKAKKMASDSVVAAVKSGGVKSGKGGAAPPS